MVKTGIQVPRGGGGTWWPPVVDLGLNSDPEKRLMPVAPHDWVLVLRLRF